MTESAIETPDTPQPKASMPIRDVAEKTGVNPVTLRAWERRYGLLTPLRTPKGHRLYRQEDVERVIQIQQWLNRGVAVGQVKSLLEETQSLTQTQSDSDDSATDWQPTLNEACSALLQGQISRFDQTVNQIGAIYPVSLLVRFFWLPLLDWLNQQSDSDRRILAEIQLEGYLRSRAGARMLHRQPPSQQQQKLLITQLPSQQPQILLWLAVLSCIDRNIPVITLEQLPSWSLLHLMSEQQAISGLLLFSNDKLPKLKTREQQQVNSLPFPCYLSGPASLLPQEQLTDAQWQVNSDWLSVLEQLRLG